MRTESLYVGSSDTYLLTWLYKFSEFKDLEPEGGPVDITVCCNIREDDNDLVDHLLCVFTNKRIQSVAISDTVATHRMNLTMSQASEVTGIINKHLQGDRDLLLCQDELIDAGYGDWARL